MTFSGLPSVRDPKQSLKNSGSSASSTTSSSTSSSPTKSPLPQDQDQQQDQQQHQQQDQPHQPQQQQQQPQQQQQKQQQQQQLLREASKSNTHPSSTPCSSSSSSNPSSTEQSTEAHRSHDTSFIAAPLPQGLVVNANSAEPMSAALIEKSFQDLVQANFGDSTGAVNGGSMMDMSGLISSGHQHLGSYPSTSTAGSGSTVDLNHQHHLHHPLALSLDLNLSLQQQQQLQIHSGVSLPSLQVELRHPQPVMQPPSLTNDNSSSKKKTAPQTLNPAHSAAYRKRLNVNQVCDWCRYRKIRCDRESPCNSCQHSKRECIRSPAAVLLGNNSSSQDDKSAIDDNTATPSDGSTSPSTPASGKTKRSRDDALSDGRSRRASKSYRGTSTSSHLSSSSVTSYSSDDDNDGNLNDAASGSSSRASDQASLSPVVGSLTLAGLGLAGLGFDASLSSTSSTSRRDFQLGSPSSLTSSPSFTTSMLALESSQANNLKDQEHLERMRRIEMLLSSVIPGAAEFIAQGSSSSLTHLLPGQKQQQQQTRPSKDMSDSSNERKKSLSLITHGLDHSHRETILSPQDRLSKIALSSPARVDARPWSNSSPPGFSSLHKEKGENSWQQQHQQQQRQLPQTDYIERMKRIELLLGSVQDTQLAKALISQTQGGGSLSIESSSCAASADNVSKGKNERKMSKDIKKMSKAEARRATATANGAVVKRPHVAAGFAGQKPPPKLPQAIAEAASKKLATRKKRVSAAAARAAAAATAASTSTSAPVIASAATAVTPRSGGEDAATTIGTGSADSSATPEMASTAMHSMFGQDHSRVAAPSPTASLEIPSASESQHRAVAFSQQHQQYQQQQQAHFFAQQQQQQQQFNLAAQHQDSITFQQQLQQQLQQQQNHQGYMTYQHQPFAISNVGSMTIPLSTDPTIGNYGSLVVPASSSTSSSPTMSPRSTRANSVSTPSKSATDESTSGPLSLLQMQQQQLVYSTGSSLMQNVVGFDMSSFDLVGQQQLGSRDSQIHPFVMPQGPSSYGQQQHQHHHHPSMTIGTDGFTESGLGMNESLESLMRKNMGSLDRLMENLANENNQQKNPTVVTTAGATNNNGGHNGPQTPSHSEGSNMFDPSTQMAYLQQQQQPQQQQHQGMYPDMSRSLWVPSHTGAFTIPSTSWSPSSQPQSQKQQQQQQSSQSINISANDSPEMELDLEQLQSQQRSAQEQMQRQKQLNAHALFQQQHQQHQQQHQQHQQQHQQQQQSLQMRKGSLVVGMPQQPQHQQQHPHRASIQHQHQQTFYIPQMQDDEDDGGFQSMYDNNNEQDETATLPTSASSSSGSLPVVSSSLEH